MTRLYLSARSIIERIRSAFLGYKLEFVSGHCPCHVHDHISAVNRPTPGIQVPRPFPRVSTAQKCPESQSCRLDM